MHTLILLSDSMSCLAAVLVLVSLSSWQSDSSHVVLVVAVMGLDGPWLGKHVVLITGPVKGSLPADKTFDHGRKKAEWAY